ncbi:MAG TPA: hypothetical protein PKE64_17285 [Anaerolineae bacterium]|nr:hypothetical protein [Anaerolineae bacterium]HMR65763.1 hypothetical protein [Anaerolineae bacterium]
MDSFVAELVASGEAASRPDLQNLAYHVASATFSPALLEVDPPLWGGFWQYDVIGPGYALPVVELALLRATRLDRSWSEQTSVEQFEADLRRTVTDPRAGVWTGTLAGQACVAIAGFEGQTLITVVWYCASTGYLHAGYRAPVEGLNWPGAVTQRELRVATHQTALELDSGWWLQPVLEEAQNQGERSLARQLDLEILRLRQKP